MGSKNPRPKANAKASPTEVAQAAGCSRQLAHRLLARGMSREQIIERIAEDRRRNAELLGFPTTPVETTNGHTANGKLLTFAVAQAQKENWLCELRRLEVMRQRGELIPTSYVRLFITRLLVESKDILLAGPGELADLLAAEHDPRVCEAILRGWVERALERLYQCRRLWESPPEAVMVAKPSR
jgi:hypothetical protein